MNDQQQPATTTEQRRYKCSNCGEITTRDPPPLEGVWTCDLCWHVIEEITCIWCRKTIAIGSSPMIYFCHECHVKREKNKEYRTHKITTGQLIIFLKKFPLETPVRIGPSEKLLQRCEVESIHTDEGDLWVQLGRNC